MFGTLSLLSALPGFERELRLLPFLVRAGHTCVDVGASYGTPIDFIKCDVEGSELEVLTGATAVLREDRPVILCEIEDRHAARYGRRASSVFRFLEELGYATVTTGRDAAARNHLFVPEERLPFVGLPA